VRAGPLDERGCPFPTAPHHFPRPGLLNQVSPWGTPVSLMTRALTTPSGGSGGGDSTQPKRASRVAEAKALLATYQITQAEVRRWARKRGHVIADSVTPSPEVVREYIEEIEEN
jgi:hypothetical protein